MVEPSSLEGHVVNFDTVPTDHWEAMTCLVFKTYHLTKPSRRALLSRPGDVILGKFLGRLLNDGVLDCFRGRSCVRVCIRCICRRAYFHFLGVTPMGELQKDEKEAI